jgi:xanthosine phosphorylase
LLGCETWLATNATGGMREDLQPGTLVLVKDHINFQFTNPLIGLNDDGFGPRFIGMDNAYDPELRQKIKKIAQQLDIPLQEGVYVAAVGPSFETPAEINAFRILGGDVVGMSTVPEIIIARHCGMKAVAISVVTNLAAGLYQGILNHDETLRGAALGENKLLKLVRQFVKEY